MKQMMVMTLALMLGVSAWAYKDGTYNCKNDDGLPDNVYKISTQSFGEGMKGVPYVEAQRYYRNQDGTQGDVSIRGMAMISTSSADHTEYFTVGNMRLQFDGDRLYGCRQ